MEYTSDRSFQIWAYTVSHCFLLLRSPINEDNEPSPKSFNIDIEFGGVGYLDLPDILRGIAIREIKENLPEKFYRYPSSSGYRVFEIRSESMVYYVLAGSYRIGKSHWLSESRVLNPNLEYDEILATS